MTAIANCIAYHETAKANLAAVDTDEIAAMPREISMAIIMGAEAAAKAAAQRVLIAAAAECGRIDAATLNALLGFTADPGRWAEHVAQFVEADGFGVAVDAAIKAALLNAAERA